MLLSTDPGGDGMAIAVAPTKSNGNTGTIRAEGRREESGGGDDIAMTIALRKGDPVIPSTDSPTSSPTGPSKIPAIPKTRFHAAMSVMSRGIVVLIAFHFVIESVGLVAAAILLLQMTVDLVPLLTKKYAEIHVLMINVQATK